MRHLSRVNILLVDDIPSHLLVLEATLEKLGQNLIRALVLAHAWVGDILSLANRALATVVSEGRFVTLVLARLDPATRTLVSASAGHPSGYVLAAGDAVRHVLDSTSFPLGIVDEAEFPEGPRITRESGQVVALLTDGILEATAPDESPFGVDHALGAIRDHRDEPARGIVQALDRAVRDFNRAVAPVDDLTRMIIKVEHGSATTDVR